jgi:hypothetical protein
MRNRPRTTAAAAAALLLACRAALAGNTVNWFPTAGGTYGYNDPANWNGGTGPVPGNGDTANLQLDLPDADQTIHVTSPVGVNALKLGDTIHQHTYGRQFLDGSPITFYDPSGAPGGGVIESINSDDIPASTFPNIIANDLIVTAPFAQNGLTVNVPTASLKLSGTIAPQSPGNPIQLTFNSPSLTILDAANTYSGVTHVLGGGTLRAARAGAFSPNSDFDLANGKLDLNGFDQTVSSVNSGTGTVLLNGGATLTIQFGAGKTSSIAYTGGSGGITMIGGPDCTLTLDIANHTGVNTLRGGTLIAQNASSLGGAGASVAVPAGAVAALSLPVGAHEYSTHVDGDLTIRGKVTLNSPASVQLDISGGGKITFMDGIRLTGTNTYTSDTFIAGTAPLFTRFGVIGSDGEFGAPASALVLQPRGVLAAQSNFTSARSLVIDAGSGDAGLNGSGPASFTFQGAGNNSFTGTLQVSGTAPLTFNRTGGVVNVSPGAKILFLSTSSINLGGTSDSLSDGVHHVDVAGAAQLSINQGVKNLGAIDITQAVIVVAGAELRATHIRGGNFSIHGKATVRPNSLADGVSNAVSLSIEGDGKLDLSDNKLVTRSSIGTALGGAYSGVAGLIQKGRNGGNWSGPGIVTSQSNATGSSPLTSLGVATAQQVKGLSNSSQTAVWAGQTVTGSNTLLMYTYAGDANLDGKINVDDYARIDSNIGTNNGFWFNGDFNYDGKVNVDDYAIIDNNAALQGAPFFAGAAPAESAVSAVPEPCVATLCVVPWMCRRRRRRGPPSR